MAVDWLKLREPDEEISLDAVKRLIKDTPTARPPEGGRPRLVQAQRAESGESANGQSRKGMTHIPLPKGPGTQRWIARLKRDYPDFITKLEAGEFPSVRAAAIAAGIVRPTATFYRQR